MKTSEAIEILEREVTWKSCDRSIPPSPISRENAVAHAVSVMRSTQRQPMDTAPTDGTMVLLDFGDMDYHGPHIALGWHSARAWRSYEIVTGHPIGWWPLSVLGKDEA